MKFFHLKLPTQLNKIYIIPNNLGLYYIGLWATSFLLSVGYASNLLLFLAIMQFSLFFWWMITAHADLSQLKINSLNLANGHAEEPIRLEIYWNNESLQSYISKISMIDSKGVKYVVQISDYQNKKNFHVSFKSRGLIHFKKLEVTLQTGFWLFKTWKYLTIDLELCVYPKAVKSLTPLNLMNPIIDQNEQSKKTSNQPVELDLLKESMLATRPNRIDWKRYAQRLILVERFGESGFKQQQILNLDNITNELQLSNATYELLNFFKNQNIWYVHNKSTTHGPFNISGNSTEDLNLCLRMLALHSV